jgi:hypothetical protein
MSRLSTTVVLVLTFGMLLAYQNCGTKLQSQNQSGAISSVAAITVNGTVQKSMVDGCNYLVCSNDNVSGGTKCFIPTKMDPSLLKDGNVVTVKGVIRDDMMTACMAGPVLEVQNADLDSGSSGSPSPMAPAPEPNVPPTSPQ